MMTGYGRRGKKQRKTRTNILECHRTAWEAADRVTVSECGAKAKAGCHD